MKRSTNIDRNVDNYLAVCLWARRRYTDASGCLVVAVGTQLTTYSRIERAAWHKYLA